MPARPNQPTLSEPLLIALISCPQLPPTAFPSYSPQTPAPPASMTQRIFSILRVDEGK